MSPGFVTLTFIGLILVPNVLLATAAPAAATPTVIAPALNKLGCSLANSVIALTLSTTYKKASFKAKAKASIRSAT